MEDGNTIHEKRRIRKTKYISWTMKKTWNNFVVSENFFSGLKLSKISTR